MKAKSFIKKVIVLTAFVVAGTETFSQQDPIYGLYLNNPLVINPAYTGINNNLEAMVGYRNQWAGFDGNPTTLNASGHLSLNNNKMGVGGLIVQDKIGENKNTSLNISYAYKVELKDHQIFSFGLQGGFINYKTDPSQLTIQNPDDPAFTSFNQTKLNLGAGAVFKTDRFFAGFSVPRLLQNSVNVTDQNANVYQQHYYFLSSYLFYLSERIILKPAVLLKGVASAPISADINFNINIDRKYTAGIYTRNFNTLGLLFQLNFLEKFRFAYAIEMPGNQSVGTRFVTNEILIGIRTSAFRFHETTQSLF
jgi:type IX secretion system PorP/SprF family membrane protein